MFNGKLYKFQEIGVSKLIGNKKFLLGDAVGLGKTVQMIAAYEHLKTKLDANLKIVVVCKASAIRQVRNEFEKFTDIELDSITAKLKPEQRQYQYTMSMFQKSGFIINHELMVIDGEHLFKLFKQYRVVLVIDEIHKCKNATGLIERKDKETGLKRKFRGSRTFLAANALKAVAVYVWGMSATPLYTKVEDLYGIFKIVAPSLFPSMTRFKDQFIRQIKLPLPNGRFFFKTVGYKNLDILKEFIAPYFIGRAKSEVKDQLPNFVRKKFYVQMAPQQREAYDRMVAEAVFEYESGECRQVAEIAKITYLQTITDALNNVDAEIQSLVSPKIDELLDLLQEELKDEKVVIYSRFKKTLTLVEKELQKLNIKYWKITGDIRDYDQRFENQNEFAKAQKGVMLITDAGGESINLQTAKFMIFLNRPWAPGQQSQTEGRVWRLGSPHDTTIIIDIIVEDSIDEYILKTLDGRFDITNSIFENVERPIVVNELVSFLKEGKNYENKKGLEQVSCAAN